MILRLTEGSMAPVACLPEGAPECERCDTCETLEVWKDLYGAINNVIDHVTLADLVAKRQKHIENLDYSIYTGCRALKLLHSFRHCLQDRR